MTNYTKLLNGLDNLEMYLIKENLDTYIKLVNSGEKSVVDALYELVEIELAQKRIRAINGCIKVANFPFFKTLDDFDFGFQPGINKQELLDLASLRFIEQKENILFVGTSGVGKTHLATAIGMESAKPDFPLILYHFSH